MNIRDLDAFLGVKDLSTSIAAGGQVLSVSRKFHTANDRLMVQRMQQIQIHCSRHFRIKSTERKSRNQGQLGNFARTKQANRFLHAYAKEGLYPHRHHRKQNFWDEAVVASAAVAAAEEVAAVAAALDGHQNGPEAEEAADAIQRQHFGQDAVAVQVNEAIHPLAATDVHHY